MLDDPRPLIRKWRKHRGLTQHELAVLSGVDEYSISRDETGDRDVSADRAAKYARVFKCSIWDLMVSPHSMSPEPMPETDG